MHRPGGYLTIVGSDAPRAVEYDTAGCGHCQRVILTKPASVNTVYLFPQRDGTMREEAGAFCRNCMTPVCLSCHDLGVCLPAEKMLDLMDAQAKWARGVL